MTTIAVKDNIIAYDSRMVEEGTIYSDNYQKMKQVEGYTIFGAGSLTGIAAITKAVLTEQYNCEESEMDNYSCIWIAKGGDLQRAFFSKRGTLVIEPQDPNIHWAMGSGADFAIGAMDAGASAREAVKIASQRDVGTGGKIRTWKLR